MFNKLKKKTLSTYITIAPNWKQNKCYIMQTSHPLRVRLPSTGTTVIFLVFPSEFLYIFIIEYHVECFWYISDGYFSFYTELEYDKYWSASCFPTPQLYVWENFPYPYIQICILIFFFLMVIYSCISGRAGSLLLCGLFSRCGAWASHCRAALLQGTGSKAGSFSSDAHGLSSCSCWALKHRLKSCSTRASLLRGPRDLPWSGIEPVSPALAGGFFTTEPPGKPQYTHLFVQMYNPL